MTHRTGTPGRTTRRPTTPSPPAWSRGRSGDGATSTSGSSDMASRPWPGPALHHTVFAGRYPGAADEAVLTLFRPPGRLHARHGDASVETRLVKLTEEDGEAAEAIIGAASPFSELRK